MKTFVETETGWAVFGLCESDVGDGLIVKRPVVAEAPDLPSAIQLLALSKTFDLLEVILTAFLSQNRISGATQTSLRNQIVALLAEAGLR